MATMTFHGGVSLSEHKELTVDRKIRSIPAPPELILPLSQHTGSPNEPLVKAGDPVKSGQCVGRSKAFMSAPVHSPVSGRVKAIGDFFNPIYGKKPTLVIENDGKHETQPLEIGKNPDTLSKEELVDIVKNAGIVGLGGAAFPTHVKLSVPKGKEINTLIANGSECEPYLTCDHRLMMEKTDEFLKGIYLTARALGVKGIVLAIEENKLSAVFRAEKAIRGMSKIPSYVPTKIEVLKTKYPQGGEKQLIKAVLGREVPPGKLPLDVGVVVQNVGTCFAIYQAVYEGKPLTERCLTLTGSCLKEPGNFTVKLGTPLSKAVEYCGGFAVTPAKIIVGGPMMGVAQYTPEVPVVKGVTGVLFLSRKEAEIFEESPCVRCAKCVDTCPVNLVPTEIMRMVKYSRWHYLSELNPSDCMECGSCAYTCPSKIPLTQYIKLAKAKELEKK